MGQPCAQLKLGDSITKEDGEMDMGANGHPPTWSFCNDRHNGQNIKGVLRDHQVKHSNSIDERQTQRGNLSKFTQASVRPRLDPYLLTSSPVLKTSGTARCRGERLLRTIFYALP